MQVFYYLLLLLFWKDKRKRYFSLCKASSIVWRIFLIIVLRNICTFYRKKGFSFSFHSYFLCAKLWSLSVGFLKQTQDLIEDSDNSKKSSFLLVCFEGRKFLHIHGVLAVLNFDLTSLTNAEGYQGEYRSKIGKLY